MPQQAIESSVVSLDQYRKGNYNVLVPTATMQQISPFHRMRVEEVKISPNPADGDVFKVGSVKVGNSWQDVLSLSKTGILKLANAGGIIWNWNETRVLSASRDYVLYQAVGAIRKPSGEWIPLKATKEIDMEVIQEELMEANLKKSKSVDKKQLNGLTPEQWAEQQTRANMIQWRKNKLMRAETGAMLRVVRALLAIKHQYSPAELQKPFVVPRVDFSPDYNDPEVRRMIMEHGVKATADLFGAASAPQSLPPAQAIHEAMDTKAFVDPPVDAGQIENFQGETIDYGPVDINPGEPPEEEPPSFTEGALFPPDGNTGPDGEPLCEMCAAPVSQKVADFSKRKFNQCLCMNCQKEVS